MVVGTARRMFQRSSGTGSGAKQPGSPTSPSRLAPARDDAQLLQQLQQEVESLDPGVWPALQGSSDLPSGAADELPCLLQRYLAAEKRSVAKAAQRLREQAQWRRQFGLVNEAEVPNEIAAAKVLLQPPAPSGPGRPLIVVVGRNHFPGDAAELERFIVLTLDTACQFCWGHSSPDGKLAAVFDLKGISMRNLQISALRAVFSTLERRFPERLHACYMLDAPTIFNAAWYLVEPFVDPTSRKRLRFISRGERGQAALLEAVGAATLPLAYGGRAQPMPIEQAVRELAAWQQQQTKQKQQEEQQQQQQ